jgi:hypothetical protein
LGVQERQQMVEMRPVINFRDPTRNAHTEVPAVAVEMMGSMNCVGTYAAVGILLAAFLRQL